MFASFVMGVMARLLTTYFTLSIIVILATSQVISESEVLVYNEWQCQDLCLRNESCNTYGLGPLQASGKMPCLINPQNGKPLDLKVSICLSVCSER